MKAIIMAGGKGTRLYPLTCQIPKPLVPLLDRPCMEYMIELLKANGITEIAVTLQYLPKLIKNHFGDGSAYGVSLHYFEETVPLGTAGSVKNAEEFLDETFLVISGDGLTDFDLSKAIAFHNEKKALGTILLTHVDVPLDYGVVMTEEDGRVVRFLEKPSWNEVFSDTVNTGIYVLEPETLGLFAKDTKFDFSKDLFPLLLKDNLPLYGVVMEGYWSDIGNLAQYRQTQFDILNRKINVPIKGVEVRPGVWVGNDATIHQGVRISGPAFIGEGTVLENGVSLGPYAVLGRYNHVEISALLEGTVVWNRNFIGKSSNLTGVTLCNGIKIGSGVTLLEHVIVGDKCRIGDLAVIKSQVRIWPEKIIGPSSMVQSSLIWGNSVSQNLFGPDGIRGIPNLELHPELAGRIASAYGSCLPRGGRVSISCDDDYFSEILKFAMLASLLAIGIRVRDIGTTLSPIARFACRSTESDGAIHILKVGELGEPRTLLQFFDREGLPLDNEIKRKVENAFLQEDFARPDTLKLARLERIPYLTDHYLEAILTSIQRERIQTSQLNVLLHCDNPQVISSMNKLLRGLGCQIITTFGVHRTLEEIIKDNCVDLGVKIDSCAQRLELFTEKGRLLTEEEMMVLQVLVYLEARSPVAIPVTAPSLLEKLTNDAGIQVIRTKNLARDQLEVRKNCPLQIYDDAFYFLALLLHYLTKQKKSLQQVMEELPAIYMRTEQVACPVEAKGRVMRQLIKDMQGQEMELIDGIKITEENAWALILPDLEKAFFKVVMEGSSEQNVEELAKRYKQKIALYQKKREEIM